MEIGVLVLIGLAIYAFTQSQAGVTTGTMPSGPVDWAWLRPAAPPGAQPGSQPGGGGAGILGPGIEGLKKALNAAKQQTPPGSVTPPANVPYADPETLQFIVDSTGMTLGEFASMAGQFGLAPEQLASVVSAGGSEFAQLATGGGVIGPVSADTVAGVGSSAMGSFGAWAGPAAAALAIGAAVIMTAMQGEHINQQKDAQRKKMAAFGKERVYQIINTWFDTLLATGERPLWMTDRWMFANGFTMDALDSAKDLWGQDGVYQAALAKQNAYLARDQEYRNWFNVIAGQVWEGTHGAALADPEGFLRTLIARYPPPAWLSGWTLTNQLMRMSAADLVHMFNLMRWDGANIRTVQAISPQVYIQAGGVANMASTTGGEA